MSITRWGARGALGAVALIVIGVAIGLFSDHMFLHGNAAALLHGDDGHAGVAAATVVMPGEATPAMAHEAAIASMSEYVGLDAEQTAAIDAIFRHQQHTVTASWQELHGRLQEAIDSVETQISRVLRPDQKERFDRWVARHHPDGREGVERVLTADPHAVHSPDDPPDRDPHR